MSYLHLFCAFVSKMSPKVIASLLDTIPAYKRFQRNAVLSNSGGKLYMYVYNQLSSSYFMSGIDLGIWNKANKSLLHGSCLLAQGE